LKDRSTMTHQCSISEQHQILIPGFWFEFHEIAFGPTLERH
jgi:hypothetical protein